VFGYWACLAGHAADRIRAVPIGGDIKVASESGLAIELWSNNVHNAAINRDFSAIAVEFQILSRRIDFARLLDGDGSDVAHPSGEPIDRPRFLISRKENDAQSAHF
jgi:hypothetical protein